MTPRVPQLDLLRAAAISLVVVYHLVQMSPVAQPAVMRWVRNGQYGVDLFFVLSGWLIGGLYWREFHLHGDVAAWRFWGRRAVRTIPPYLAGLLLAWTAVYLHRREPFDWGFLLFCQNYYHGEIPFFVVSWSLCVEEHFYVLVPLATSLVGPRRLLSVPVFVLLLLAPTAARFWTVPAGTPLQWAHFMTATHLRCEGLLLGFWIASLPHAWPPVWQLLAKRRYYLAGVALFLLSVPLWLSERAMYQCGFTLLAIGFAALLVSLQFHRWSASRVVHAIAVATYSVYLTHALVINFTRQFVIKMAPGVWWPVYYPMTLILIGLAGAAFYFAVERPSIRLRDRLVPARAAYRASAVQPG